jgi:hypothetical protein
MPITLSRFDDHSTPQQTLKWDNRGYVRLVNENLVELDPVRPDKDTGLQI